VIVLVEFLPLLIGRNHDRSDAKKKHLVVDSVFLYEYVRVDVFLFLRSTERKGNRCTNIIIKKIFACFWSAWVETMIFHSSIFRALALLTVTSVLSPAYAERLNEYKILEDHLIRDNYHSPLPYTYMDVDDLPDEFCWGDVNGHSYLTHSLNQHIPQYCGSCWAHGSLSALADRIKITNSSKDEINLSIQYVLNCGTRIAGSCHGGSHTGVYDFIVKKGFIPYDTCQPYLACSEESTEGICEHVDTSCTASNTCKTCDTFGGMGGACTEIDFFPNATIAEYGTYSILSAPESIVDQLKAEIYARGPVA